MHGTLHANLDLYKARFVTSYPRVSENRYPGKQRDNSTGRNFMNAINSPRRIYSLAESSYAALYRRLFNIRGENFRGVSITIGGVMVVVVPLLFSWPRKIRSAQTATMAASPSLSAWAGDYSRNGFSRLGLIESYGIDSRVIFDARFVH